MPSERFFRLPNEKIELIRSAAIREFKRVSPDEASINKIIQNAGISRGSFYTYFTDKEDLVKWVLGDFINHYRQFYLEELELNDGNIWDVFDRVLHHTMHWVAEQGLVEIVGNMMKSSTFAERSINNPSEECELMEENKKYSAKVYQLINPKCCQVSPQEFEELLRLQVSALAYSMKLYFVKGKTVEEVEAAYQRCMKLLCYGAHPRHMESEEF
ncbi:MAG: TetR/AcrR family transcriptional regulator [Lachnospiraceae bacterium]|nr:TetR/AcrR family transcriptional regulator [Lachnospiraceae bacterium]